METGSDVIVQAADLPAMLSSKQTRHWGSFDGSGDPIDKTFEWYLANFVADKAFSGLGGLNAP